MGPAGAGATGQDLVVRNVSETQVNVCHCNWSLLVSGGVLPHGWAAAMWGTFGGTTRRCLTSLGGGSWGRSPTALM